METKRGDIYYLPKSEFNRIKDSLKSKDTSFEDEKERIKELNKTRANTWNNTVLGDRMLKLV